MATLYAALVFPSATITVLDPSLPEATKSLPAASDTVRFTLTPPAGAALDSVTVNSAAAPSVTGEVLAEIVAVGALLPVVNA